MMILQEFLPTVPIFATLEPAEIEILARHVESKVYAENEYIFRENDPGEALYVVAAGAVRIVKMIDGQHSKSLTALVDRDFFGEMALLDGQRRSASAQAARRSTVLRVTNERFQALMQEAPYAALKIIMQIACHLAARLRATNQMVAELESWRILRG